MFQGLSREQLDAVLHSGSPLAIIAGPGSGKTRTLVARILKLIDVDGIPAQRILGITFTRQAAQEMRDRIEKALGFAKSGGILIANFHQLCLQILREKYSLAGFEAQPIVVSGNLQKNIIKSCISKRLGAEKVAALREKSEKWKAGDDDWNPEQFIESSQVNAGEFNQASNVQVPEKLVSVMLEFIKQKKEDAFSNRQSDAIVEDDRKYVFIDYLKKLKELCAVDFFDMIPLTIRLFRRNPSVLKEYQTRFQFILCDEFQDVSSDQLELLWMLSKDHSNITVCGDDDQSIYGWRGALVEGFRLFQKQFPNSSTVFLTQTFRSTESIVDVLNSIIVKNQCRAAKEIHTLHPRGTNPKLFVCTTTSDEFRKIATEIQQLKEKENLQFSSIAVLARTQRACQEVQSALMKSNIPCSRKARESLVNLSKLKEVQDILAYFKLACKFDSSQQDKAFLRVINVPSRQLGKSAIESIQEYSKLRNLDLFVASCQLCGKGSSRLNPRHRKALESFIMCIKSMKNLSNERPLDALEKFLSISKYDDFIQAKSGKDSTKLSNLNLLKELMQKSEISTLQEFMDQLENPDEKSGILAYKPSNDFVTISTIHQSKGREWDCVFLCRFNEGILPLGSHPILNCKISNSESHSLEEERRLAYVAMSRAKRFLYISLSQVDRFGNSLSPSRFLDEIPQRLFEKTSMPVKPIQETSTTNSFVSASSLLSKNTPAKDQESSKPRKSSSSTAHSQKSSFFQPTLSSFMAKRQKSEESR